MGKPKPGHKPPPPKKLPITTGLVTMKKQQHSVVFIANTGKNDPPLPGYLVKAFARFEREGIARYKLIAHDVEFMNLPLRVNSNKLGLSGTGESVQYALLDMLGKFDPGKY